MTGPRVSIVIPAFNEADAILPALNRIADSVTVGFDVLVVVDVEDDTTVPIVTEVGAEDGRFRLLVQDYGPGPANAIRYGIDHADAPVVVVSMADGSDDVRIIDDLVRLVERGVAVAAASRYMPGGQQVGGPMAKGFLSQAAGRSLHLFARAGTHDATNSFKAYDAGFVRAVGIESRDGFEIGIELVAKATRAGLPVAEIPTIWLDRTQGASNFHLRRWLPQYLRWYRFAFGPRMTLDELRARRGRLEERRA